MLPGGEISSAQTPGSGAGLLALRELAALSMLIMDKGMCWWLTRPSTVRQPWMARAKKNSYPKALVEHILAAMSTFASCRNADNQPEAMLAQQVVEELPK